MGHAHAKVPVREVRIEAVVLNADGTVKRNLGTVAYYHRNPLRRLAHRLHLTH
jgi:hypothetical protein